MGPQPELARHGRVARHSYLHLCRAGELGVLLVREHPLSTQVHPLIAKGTPRN